MRGARTPGVGAACPEAITSLCDGVPLTLVAHASLQMHNVMWALTQRSCVSPTFFWLIADAVTRFSARRLPWGWTNHGQLVEGSVVGLTQTIVL